MLVGRRGALGWLAALVFAACGRDGRAARIKPAEAPGWRGLLYLRQERPGAPRDLWVQSLDGKRRVALTDSGLVAAWERPRVEGAINGAVISPDGARVAYAERHPVAVKEGVSAPAQAWNVLFVVNADGTGRRRLVDLREPPFSTAAVRAGSFIWSSDGARLAYVVESIGGGCARVRLHQVEVDSSRATSLQLDAPLGDTQLLVWDSPRDVLSFASLCGATEEQRLGLLRMSTGALWTLPAERPSVSPDGARAFVAASVLPSGKAALLSLDSKGHAFTRESVLESPSWGRFNWYQKHAGGLFTAVTPERQSLECMGVTPPPQRLYRWDARERALQLVRQDATAFTTLAFSPDDTQALVSVLVGRDDSLPGFCGDGWLRQLHLVPREALESELPREQLLARSIALEPPTTWPGASNLHYIGWLR
ncbi:hypothetical protein [Myxococcus stipitatus]|uniref:TolB family protein n=1 Tax=Myxococcus stipitatus TaxID=83455 RepID=UPI0030CFAE4B